VSDAENPPATASARFSLGVGVVAEAISTTPGAGGPVGSTTVTDAATLTGGSSPSGTITFNLYGPSDTADCSGAPVDTETAAVIGNGTYTAPTGYIPAATGTYWWTVSYGGDSNNDAVSSTCGDEQGEFDLIGGFNPTGTITFTLYGRPDCTDPLSTEPQGVSGDGNYSTGSILPGFTGTFYWVAAYSGDNNNLAVTSDCDSEPVTVTQALTTLTTSAQPQVAVVGSQVADVGTLTGGFNPTGAILFRLYGAPNCQGATNFTAGASVDGDGSYTSGAIAVPEAGFFYWVATYSGDNNNLAVTSDCNADPVEVDSP
jgi:hypothetical protein